jgi:putative hydrolase of the HAD superfamily
MGSGRKIIKFRERKIMIECILSDVHNVIILWDNLIIKTLERSFSLEDDAIMQTAFNSKVGYAAMIGDLTHQEWAEHLATELPQDLLEQWLSYFGEVNTEYLKLLVNIKKKGIRIGFLTNATSRLEIELLHHNLNELPDFIVASYQAGLAKPEEAFYRYAIEVAACDVKKILYIDDDPLFVLAGRSVGLHSIQYTNCDNLISKFQDIGLYPNK